MQRVRAVVGRASSALLDRWPLLVICALGVTANLVWLVQHRRGLPFDIDEAGYLERAIIDGQVLDDRGISGFLSHLHSPDPQAPLLPATAGVVHALLGVGPIGMMATQEIFYVALVVAAWSIAGRLGGRGFAIVMAIVTAALPGAIDVARSFQFALVAAAAFAVALALLLRCESFDSSRRAVAWGVALGFAALSRTMVLGLLPGLLLAAGVRILGVGISWRRVGHLALAIAVGFLVAWSWYSASWHNVFDYLRSYGYGAQADSYGPGHRPLSPAWWVVRFDGLAETSVHFLVIIGAALAVGATIGAALVGAAARRRADVAVLRAPTTADVRSAATSDVTSVAVVAVYCYLALSSTRNLGSLFELPIVVPILAVVLHRAWRRDVARGVMVVAMVGVSAFTVVQSTGLLPLHYRQVRLGTKGVPVYDDRGRLGDTARRTLLLPSSDTDAQFEDQLRAYQSAAGDASRKILERTRQAVVQPVLFFGTQDPWFNTNSLSLDLLLLSGRETPIGVFLPAPATAAAAGALLEDPARGEPNVVITGPVFPNPGTVSFNILDDPAVAEAGLRQDGFTAFGTVAMPDGRSLTLWFKKRGPVLPGR